MTLLLYATSLVVLGSFAAAGVRVVRGPDRVDRMLAAQLIGTLGTALFFLFAELHRRQGASAEGVHAFHDVAVLVSLVAVLGVVAFTRRGLLVDTGERDG